MFALLSSLRQQSGDGNFLLTLLLLFSRSPAYLTVLRHTCDNTLNYSLKKQQEDHEAVVSLSRYYTRSPRSCETRRAKHEDAVTVY